MPLGIGYRFLVLLIPIAIEHQVSGIWFCDGSFISYVTRHTEVGTLAVHRFQESWRIMRDQDGSRLLKIVRDRQLSA